MSGCRKLDNLELLLSAKLFDILLPPNFSFSFFTPEMELTEAEIDIDPATGEVLQNPLSEQPPEYTDTLSEDNTTDEN